jgi:GDP-4-dehydro-6-deoxy-D-mannose reductase
VRVLVTGARGFVGRWLVQELVATGHEAVAAPGSSELDLGSEASAQPLASLMRDVDPDAVAHLAAVASARDARDDPGRAAAVAIGGTTRVVAAMRHLGHPASLLVTGSSEVYGAPDPSDLPLRESAPVRGATAYARSKIAQEQVALAGASLDRPVVVTRAFNHTGPGQRTDFVVPALARRIVDVRAGRATSIRVGNLDVRRDFADVRDVVRAYRLILEAMGSPGVWRRGVVFNVATGRSVTIRSILGELWAGAGLRGDPVCRVDPALVRPDEPPDIRGDASALTSATGWVPAIPLSTTLQDLLERLSA